MRIRLTDTDPFEVLQYGANTTPCGWSDWGEVEDYTVKIVPYSPHTFYKDADGDGFGDPANSITNGTATPPSGYVANNTDCDDNDAAKHGSFSFYADHDGDGYGTGLAVSVCAVDAATPPAGYSLNNTDCDDNDNSKWRSASLYVDADGDGYDNGSTNVCYGTNVPQGYSTTTQGSDCNDQAANVHAQFSFYVDSDGDGYGAGSLVSVCAVDANTPPTGYSTNNTDCAPSDATKWQSANLYIDSDGDGYDNGQQMVCYGTSVPTGYKQNTLGSDCDDQNAAVHPGAVEICGDGIDNNCNGQIDENCTVPYSLSINDVAMNEGNKGKSNMTFTVTLNKAFNKKVTVRYTTQNGTATAGTDYTANSGTLTFNPGSTKQSVAISIIGDKTVEPNETFTLVLRNPVNAGLLKGTGTGTILNDDGTTSIAARAVDVKAGALEVSGKLTVTVSPNPSYSYFTLHTKSGSDKPLQVRTIDVSGRQIESQGGVPANGTLRLGGNYRPGSYFTEVIQGSDRVIVKLIKQIY